jgi:hypothetical protein
MITDFNEIKNERDRELYVEYRNVLDNMFLEELEKHKSKNHILADCEPLLQQELAKHFPTRLAEEVKSTGDSEVEVIMDWIHHNQVQLFMYLDSLRILRAEYNKRKQ